MCHGTKKRLATGLLGAGFAWTCLHAEEAPPTAASAGAAAAPATAASGPEGSVLQAVTITAPRLLGTATSASEGSVSDRELQLTPAYRPAQLLETVPGLTVTTHSGEGKATQFFLRGYSLDHGTDLATFVDGMPINQPTHAHGQGYTDLNFMIPELADGLDYTKGPYYANVGDFGSVGSVRISYRDTATDEVSLTGGSYGFTRLLGIGSRPHGTGQLLGAVELQHYDGPFTTPDDARKENMVLRFSDGSDKQGYSVTGMLYHQLWTNTTDIPVRAIAEGLVPDRFGSLDPTDGGRALRASLSWQFHAAPAVGSFDANAYYIHNELHLYNNFTHFLDDPVHGDQELQFEYRHVLGGAADYSWPLRLAGLQNELLVGASTRFDHVNLGRLHTEARVPVASDSDPPSFSNDDQVQLFAGALYAQATTHWTPALRSIAGLRMDYQRGHDTDRLATLHETAGYSNSGSASQALLQPKLSLAYAPIEALELYASAGVGFHSDDLRGVNQGVGVDLGQAHASLLARQVGEELGLRAEPARDLKLTLAVYNLRQQSETVLDPDVGQDSAGPPSHRYGAEMHLGFQLQRWLELQASYSRNHARFTTPFDDGTGHVGTYIADAPVATGTLALYLSRLGPWSGGLEYRYLGKFPLSSGPCSDVAAVQDFPGVATSCANAPTARGQVDGSGFGQWNLTVNYAPPSGWRCSLGIYNLLNKKAPAAEFWYVDRLQSEVGAYPLGRADVHEHPLEPIMARVTLARRF